jgi:hypothetical protein
MRLRDRRSEMGESDCVVDTKWLDLSGRTFPISQYYIDIYNFWPKSARALI